MKRLAIILLAASSMFATTVTSITCSGQTATVNATAHGLVASQGFSLSGSSPTFNSSAATAATNSFTFILPEGTACSGFTSGYTAVQAAKQIIDLSSHINPADGTVTLIYLFWFTTRYPNPLSCTLPPNGTTCPVSQYPLASAAENAAIVAGTTVETYGSLTVPANTSASTIQTNIVAQYNAAQAGFAGFLLAGGYWYNGTSWVNQ